MKTATLLVLGLLALGVAPLAPFDDGNDGNNNGDHHQRDQVILRWSNMVGNSGAFIGSQTPIRGINAGGAAWIVNDRARGELKTDGSLKIDVRGLTLLSGMNPVTDFAAIVSCLDINGDAQNLMTDPFPADSSGNSRIEAQVDLPSPCFAPLVFVTSPTGAWFAVTGN